MSEEQSMSVKGYLNIGGGKHEVRRFGLPEAMATNFTYMKGKVCGVYGLLGQPITLSWKDNENDDIVISSDEELMEAIADSVSHTSTNILRIYITVGARPDLGPNNSLPGSESGAHHEGVVCDGCEGPIIGFRYKCMHCKDFDLCSVCEHKGKHNEHRMMRIPSPGAKRGPKFWWREHGGPAGHFSNTDNGGNTFSQTTPGSASGGCQAEAPRFRGRHGWGRGRRGHLWGSGFGRPCGGAWVRGFGCHPGPNMAGNPVASQNQQQQNSQKEGSQKQQQQQEGCPFMDSHGATEFSEEAARAADEAGKMAEEVAAQASQFASQFASQMASEQVVADVMKSIFSAFSGQEGAHGQATSSAVPQGNTAASNSNTGINQNSGKEAGKMADVAAQASQFASQFASEMASEHVANVMRGIFTPWSGQKGAQAQATSGAVPQGDTAASNSNTGINQTQSENNSAHHTEDCGIHRCYNFRRIQTNTIRFRVQARNDVCLCLSPDDQGRPENMYEVFIGGWEGTKSAIRRKQAVDVCEVETPDIVSADEMRGFWIKISHGVIKVGREGESHPFMSYTDPEALLHVTHYGFCTAYGSKGDWTFSDDKEDDASNSDAEDLETLEEKCIDVEVSVNHNGIHQQCTDDISVDSATTSSTAPSAPVAVTATQTPPPTPVATATQTPFIAATQTTQTQQASAAPTVIIPSSEETSHSFSQVPGQVEVTAPTNIQEIELEADHSTGGWTVVNGSLVAGPSNAPSPHAISSGCGQGAKAKSPQVVNYPSLTEFHPPTPQHPNPVIQRAVDQMIAMGYNNEEGWLTQLLEAKQGDMNKVLDLLQPVKKI